MSLLSELVSFHSHLHRCWRIWIIHAICVIYVFAYSWRHKSVYAVSFAEEVNEGISWVHDGWGEAFILFVCFFIIIVSWNWILYEPLFHKETMTVAWCKAAGADRRWLVLPFCLPPWLTECHSHSVTSPEKKIKKKNTAEKAHRASGRGFPQPPSLISFSAWSSDRRQKQTESNLEKMREWRSQRKKKKKRRGESGDKGWSQEADSR